VWGGMEDRKRAQLLKELKDLQMDLAKLERVEEECKRGKGAQDE
jgi:hypothetical protein